MDNLILKDVYDVYAQSIANPSDVTFLGLNSKADWNQKLNNTILRAGIGMLSKALIQDSRESTFSVEPLLFSESLMKMITGTVTTNGSATVKVNERLQITGGEITIVGTPATGVTTADCFDAQGKHYAGTIATKVVTITSPPADGTWITVCYDSTVTGNITPLSADKFPQAYKLFAHTVLWNPETNTIYADVYLNFYKAIPDGTHNLSVSAGKEATQPVNFQLLTPLSSNDFGQYISVPRSV